MSKIEQYPVVNPEVVDKIIITQVKGTPTDATKNVTVQGIIDLVPLPIEVTVNVPSAAILNMQSTPVELVAAQGAGTYIKVLEVSLFLNFNTTRYTQAGTVEFTVGTDFQAKLSNSVDILTANQDQVGTLELVSNGAAIIAENTALRMETADPITVGDSNLEVKIRYQVLNKSNF